MSYILSIESSTRVCSVAVHDKGELLGEITHLTDYSHSEKLLPMIDTLMKRLSLSNTQLSAIAVSKGPGSYTGLRIGTSTAKGLCYALSVPLIAVDSLTSLANQVLKQAHKDQLLCPMLDARRMEVFCAIYDQDLRILREISPVLLEEENLQNFLNQSEVLFFGNGSEKAKKVITDQKAQFLNNIESSAVSLGSLAWSRFMAGNVENVVYFEPYYLKEFMVSKPKPKI